MRRRVRCVWQDDKVEKLKGVMSLIKYAALSDYMLVPTEEASEGNLPMYPETIPGYGASAPPRLRCTFAHEHAPAVGP